MSERFYLSLLAVVFACLLALAPVSPAVVVASATASGANDATNAEAARRALAEGAALLRRNRQESTRSPRPLRTVRLQPHFNRTAHPRRSPSRRSPKSCPPPESRHLRRSNRTNRTLRARRRRRLSIRRLSPAFRPAWTPPACGATSPRRWTAAAGSSAWVSPTRPRRS